MYDTIASSPVRVLRLKQLSERFRNHIWAGAEPGEFAAIKQYVLVTYSLKSGTHSLQDHDDFKIVVEEVQRHPHWVPVFIVDLDTNEQLDVRCELKVFINDKAVN